MKKLITLAALLAALLLPVSAEAAVCVEGDDITVSWHTANDSNGITEFNIYRDTTSDMANAVVVGTVDSGTLSFKDMDLPDGSYYYQIEACDACGNCTKNDVSNQALVDTEGPVFDNPETHAG